MDTLRVRRGGPALPAPGPDLHSHFNAIMKRTSVALYGRRMYEVMRFWDTYESRPGSPEVEVDFARAWQKTPKLVFSTKLRDVGPNARLVRNNLEAEVKALKAEADGEIAIGGAGFAASLSRLGLIDEYRLYLHPIVLGAGKPFFEPGTSLQLRPLGTETLDQGVVFARYGRADEA